MHFSFSFNRMLSSMQSLVVEQTRLHICHHSHIILTLKSVDTMGPADKAPGHLLLFCVYLIIRGMISYSRPWDYISLRGPI